MASDPFVTAVKAHRRKQVAWTSTSVKRLDGILRLSASDVKADVARLAGTGKLEEAYKQALLNSLNLVLDNLAKDAKDILNVSLLGAAQIEAEQEAAIIQLALDGVKVDQYTTGLPASNTQQYKLTHGMSVQVSFGHVAESAVEHVWGRAVDGLTLTDRLWKVDTLIREEMENRIVAGIARGQSARDLARDLAGYLTDEGKGNARYNSMRVARTEIGTAGREGHRMAAVTPEGGLKDHLSALGWRLSASHPVPDVCDIWASQDDHGLGAGNYPPDSLPVDHPHGMCYVVSILKRFPELQFVQLKPQPEKVDPDTGRKWAIGKRKPKAP